MARKTNKASSEQVARFLHALPMFERVAARSRAFQRFLAQVRVLHLEKGALLYKAGESPTALFVVREGEVHIVQRGAESRLVGIHGRGSLFGEVSLLTGEPHSSHAVASLDSSICCIPGDALLELMAAEPSVGRAMAELLSERLRQNLQEEPSESPARMHALFYPENPRRGSEFAAALAGAIAQQSPGPCLVISFNPASMFRHAERPSILDILSRWPDISIWQMIELMDLPDAYDVLDACIPESSAADQDRIAAMMPDLLGRLRKYYAVILVEAGRETDNPALARALSQCDRVVLFRTPRADSRDAGRWKEIAAFCDELTEDFFEQAIPVTDDYHGASARGMRIVNPNSALFRNHMLLRSLGSGPVDRNYERGFQAGVNRLARRLSGASRALCLGGGGARAFAEVGVLEVLEQEGIDFDAVAGVSMGAVIGAAYAQGRDASEIAYLIRQIIPDSKKIFDKTVPLVSFFRGRRLNRAVLAAFGDARFEDLELPFFCNASDLDSGQTVVFESGYLSTAVRASVSLPGIFPPFKLGGYSLVDGGVLNNLPGDVLRDKGYHRVLGVNVTPLEDPRSAQTKVLEREGSLWDRVKDYFSLPPILTIIQRSIAIQGIELMKFRIADFDYVLHPDIRAFDLFDFDQRERIIDIGRQCARENLQGLREMIYRPGRAGGAPSATRPPK